MEGTRLAGSGPFLPRKPLAGEPSEAKLFARSRETFATSSNGHHSAGQLHGAAKELQFAVDNEGKWCVDRQCARR